MSLSVRIELDGAAVPKGRHQSRINEKKDGTQFVQEYPDPKTVKYEARLRYAAQCAMEEQNPGAPPTILPCRVWVDVHMQAPQTPEGGQGVRAAMLAGLMRPTKRPDADNYLKTVGDALNGVIWKDDSAIVEATVRKWWAENPSLVVTVETVDPPSIPAVSASHRAKRERAGAGDLFAGAAA